MLAAFRNERNGRNDVAIMLNEYSHINYTLLPRHFALEHK